MLFSTIQREIRALVQENSFHTHFAFSIDDKKLSHHYQICFFSIVLEITLNVCLFVF